MNITDVSRLREDISKLEYDDLVTLLALIAKDRGYISILIERENLLTDPIDQIEKLGLEAVMITPSDTYYSYSDFSRRTMTIWPKDLQGVVSKPGLDAKATTTHTTIEGNIDNDTPNSV